MQRITCNDKNTLLSGLNKKYVNSKSSSCKNKHRKYCTVSSRNVITRQQIAVTGPSARIRPRQQPKRLRPRHQVSRPGLITLTNSLIPMLKMWDKKPCNMKMWHNNVAIVENAEYKNVRKYEHGKPTMHKYAITVFNLL